MGKNRPDYASHYNSSNEKVIVVNASNIKVSRNKLKTIKYYSYTGYPRGLRIKELGDYMKKTPIKCWNTIVRKQLPTNNIRDKYLSKLIVCPGPYHDLHTKGIPQFMQRIECDPYETDYFKIEPQTHQLLYSSTGENPEELKNIPKIDPTLTAPSIATSRLDYPAIQKYKKKMRKFVMRKSKESKGL